MDDEEHEVGVRCLGAPLFNPQRHVVGAVSITSLTFRVPQETLLSWWPLLDDTARKVSAILQHQ